MYNFPVAPTRASPAPAGSSGRGAPPRPAPRGAPSLFSGLLTVAALATAASFILSRGDRRP